MNCSRVNRSSLRRSGHVCRIALAVLCLLTVSQGQVATTGKITGVVADASGAVLPAATVTVHGPSLMADRGMRTQPDGSYLFDLLPPGTYELIASSNGFKTMRQTGIVISAGFTATVNPKLPLGQVQETVTVTGE